MKIRKCAWVAVAFCLSIGIVQAEPMAVRRVQGYLHGFVVLKDMTDKIIASGDLTQTPSGNHLTTILSIRFRDGSLWEETSVFSQRKVFQLVSYKQVQKGVSFKTPQTLSLNTSTGKVSVEYAEKDGSVKTIDKQMPLPPDLANGIITMLLTNADPKVETTLSMLVSTPKPRLVKLKILAVEHQDSFLVCGVGARATHYVVKIDIGGATGVVAKAVGKQPSPINMWIAAGNAPVFLKSEGAFYEDGPIWRIELASPTWPKEAQTAK